MADKSAGHYIEIAIILRPHDPLFACPRSATDEDLSRTMFVNRRLDHSIVLYLGPEHYCCNLG